MNSPGWIIRFCEFWNKIPKIIKTGKEIAKYGNTTSAASKLVLFFLLKIFQDFQSSCSISGENMISFLLSNESLCDGPTNGSGGRTPHFYSCFYDLNGMKLLFLWLLTSSKRFLFICFINQETFPSPQQQKRLLWNVFSGQNQNGNKLENLPQRNIFFPGLRGIEMDRNEIYVFNFPLSNLIQIKIPADWTNRKEGGLGVCSVIS